MPRKFFRDEENPYDAEPKASSETLYIDEQTPVLPNVIPDQPLIKNIDESSRRTDTSTTGIRGRSDFYGGAVFNGIAGEDLEPGQPVYIVRSLQNILHLSFKASSNNTTSTSTVNVGNVAGQVEKIGISFLARRTTIINSISQVIVGVVGAPGDNFRVGIQGDNAGSPDGVYIFSNLVAGAGTWDFSLVAPVTKGTRYHVVAERTGAIDAANYWTVKTLSGGDAYPSTTAVGESYNGTAWVSANQLSCYMTETYITDNTSDKLYKASIISTAYYNSYVGINLTYSLEGEKTLYAVSGFIGSLKSTNSGSSTVNAGTQYGVGTVPGTISSTLATTKPVGVGVETATQTLVMREF